MTVPKDLSCQFFCPVGLSHSGLCNDKINLFQLLKRISFLFLNLCNSWGKKKENPSVRSAFALGDLQF